MKLLVLDNYDSFTYNLVHLVEYILNDDVTVKKNDELSLEEVKEYDKIICSPGPGIPTEAGLLMPVIKKYAASKSILGVCLGHQAIVEVFGGCLENLKKVQHGVATNCNVVKAGRLFNNIPVQFKAGRYHSWTASKIHLPPELAITAIDDEGNIMAIEHSIHDIAGVQFHPESVLTPLGETILRNWLTADSINKL